MHAHDWKAASVQQKYFSTFPEKEEYKKESNSINAQNEGLLLPQLCLSLKATNSSVGLGNRGMFLSADSGGTDIPGRILSVGVKLQGTNSPTRVASKVSRLKVKPLLCVRHTLCLEKLWGTFSIFGGARGTM